MHETINTLISHTCAVKKLDWLKTLKPSVLQFLNKLKSKKTPGFYHYSLLGDLYDENYHWGLGNAVFASKVYYMLNCLSQREKINLANFIKSFQHNNSYIFDPLIYKLTLSDRIKQSILAFDLTKLSSKQTKRAETRQAFAALACLNQKPNEPFLDVPYTKFETRQYLERLNWDRPWDAGSHFSHLLFFWEYNKRFFNYKVQDSNILKKYALDWISSLQSPTNGSWYQGSPSNTEKINGAMKMLTGFAAANIHSFNHPDKLIDLCLKSASDRQACDNFNIIYVLYCCSKKANHRRKEIKDFCLKRLNIYRQYYFPKIGGFSFYKNKANDVYYGAIISKGLNEPDIHGTVMFLWGIALISRILKLNLKLKEPVT